MRTGRVLFTLVLAACSTLTLSSFQQAVGVLPSSQASTPLQEGKTLGVWQSPKPGQLGHARGVLGENGSPAYLIDLVVQRKPNGGVPNGTLSGKLLVPGSGQAGSPPMVVATVLGKWVHKPGSPGHFRALLIRPDAIAGDPEVIGGLRGEFVDPPMKPGSFRGEWAIFK